MAWWTLKYACGHGEHDVQLYGKHRDRESKAAWYEANVVCPECWKKQQQEKEASKPKEVIGNYNAHSFNKSRPLVFTLEAVGQRDQNKEALAELGFKWRKSFDTGWQLKYFIEFTSKEELKEKYDDIIKKLEPLGYKPYKGKPLAGLDEYKLKWIKAHLELYADAHKSEAADKIEEALKTI